MPPRDSPFLNDHLPTTYTPCRFGEPKPDAAARAKNEKVVPRPVAVCPELHNPMHTAQTAERQVNQLCKDAGLPAPDPTPEPPVSTLESGSLTDSALRAPHSALDNHVRHIRDYPEAIDAYYHVNLLDGGPIIDLPNHAQFPPPT